VGVLEPPRYPKIAHLRPHASVDVDDVVLDQTLLRRWLTVDVRIEEKLDGANVCLWRSPNGIRVLGRSRDRGRDRGNQLGPLRAWVAERSGRLLDALAVGQAVYGEWLWREHSVRYDSLPDYLIGIDVWTPEHKILDILDRDVALERAGVVAPPVLHEGCVKDVATFDRLLNTRSRFSHSLVEGLIIRRLDGHRAVVKLVRPNFRRLHDTDWAAGRPLNRLKAPDAPYRDSWRRDGAGHA